MAMGKNESTEMRLGIHFKFMSWSYVMKKALLNATIMLVIETKSVVNPNISFLGRDM